MVDLFPSPNLALSPAQKSYASIPKVMEVPNLIQVQTDSFEWFKGEALRELFQEISPIEDFTGGRFELHFLEHEFQEPSLQPHPKPYMH